MSQENYRNPNSPGFGDPAQAPRSQKVFILGPKEGYNSVCGYKKNRIPVSLGRDEHCVGYIEEEVVPGLDGVSMGCVYYERNGWRPEGALRFYASPEALLAAFGMTLGRNHALTHVEDVPVEETPSDTPANPAAGPDGDYVD